MKKNTIISKIITPATVRSTNERISRKGTSARYVDSGLQAQGKSSVQLSGGSWVIQSGLSSPRTVGRSALTAASRNSMKKTKVTSE